MREFYRVSRDTAERVNAARRAGHRVVAVGTTVVRALETVTDESGTVPGQGWTSLVITPDRPIGSVDALISGLHEPHATHLTMLERVIAAAAHRGDEAAGVCPASHLQRAYAEARQAGYLGTSSVIHILIVGAIRLPGRSGR
jgi:S-adenosylmethionine:tRNA ribosyltransferase-isomerase